jgi:MoxR-like ATPase
MKNESENLTLMHDTAQRLVASIEGAFRGKPGTVELVIAALFAGGHILVEDVPGTGKTVLAKALAKSMDLPFSRIQCTPDLMPADVTGSSVFSPKTQAFRFRRGPIHASVVLVDELNRATPRTQSALLEAMAESQVSADGRRFALPDPFFVIATENPIEFEGTFPLPEAQKDRFMLTVSPGYPDAETEATILESHRRVGNPVDDIIPVATGSEIIVCRAAAAAVHVETAIRDYVVALSTATRNDPRVAVGVSPRGSIALYKASQALAAIRGRDYAVPEDVKELLLPAFRKRLILTGESRMKGYAAENILEELALTVPAPPFRNKA